jgi:phytoene desaturase
MTPPRPRHAIVLGGGFTGLAAAIELASLGLRATLIEQRPTLAAPRDLTLATPRGTYRFDTSLAPRSISPHLRSLFVHAGRFLNDSVALSRPGTILRAFVPDQSPFDLPADATAARAELDRVFPGSGNGFDRLLAYARRMHSLAEGSLKHCAPDSPLDLLRHACADATLARELLASRAHASVARTLAAFFPDPRAAKILAHLLDPLASSLSLTPSPALRHMSRAFDHPRFAASPSTLLDAMESLARDLGVEILTGLPVTRLAIDATRLTAAELADGRLVVADAVLSTLGPHTTLRDLIATPQAREDLAELSARHAPSSSAFVLCLGLTRRYEQLAHSNVFLSEDRSREDREIFHDDAIPQDPTLEVLAASPLAESCAPPGHESLRVVMRVPPLARHHRWRDATLSDPTLPGPMLQACRRLILDTLERRGLTNLSRHIAAEHAITPAELAHQREQGATATFATHHLRGLFHAPHTTPAATNLFLAGAGCAPGPLDHDASAITAARLLAQSLGQARTAA